MRFLFRLDLSLYAGAGIFFLKFWTLQLNKGNFAVTSTSTHAQLSFEKKNARTALTKAKSKWELVSFKSLAPHPSNKLNYSVHTI